MKEFLETLFSSNFEPHGHCYLWNPGLVGLHVVSDALIAVAYFSIPVTLKLASGFDHQARRCYAPAAASARDPPAELRVVSQFPASRGNGVDGALRGPAHSRAHANPPGRQYPARRIRAHHRFPASGSPRAASLRRDAQTAGRSGE